MRALPETRIRVCSQWILGWVQTQDSDCINREPPRVLCSEREVRQAPASPENRHILPQNVIYEAQGCDGGSPKYLSVWRTSWGHALTAHSDIILQL